MLTNDLKDFVQEVVAIMVASRDANLIAHGTRAYGAFSNQEGTELTFYVHQTAFEKMHTSLMENGQLALAFARPTDYLAIQVKGRYISHKKTDARDDLVIERYLMMFAEIVEKLGGKGEPYRVLPVKPAIAVTMKIEAVFQQTPGKSTGARII